jgi:hypothetical protein
VEFRVTTKGPTFDTLIRDTSRDLRSANRKVGREVGKVGAAAMNKGAPRMFGRVLRVKPKVDARPDGCRVEFNPAPRQSGGWGIAESGRRGGYTVAPKRRRALHYDGRFAMVTHPGSVGGRHAWSQAGDRLERVLDRTVADVYDDALGV